MKTDKTAKTDYSDSVEDKKNLEAKKKKSKSIALATIAGIIICVAGVALLLSITNLRSAYSKVEKYVNSSSQQPEYDSLPLREFDSEYLSLDNASFSQRDEKKEEIKEQKSKEENSASEEISDSVSAKYIGKTQNGKQSISEKFTSPVSKGKMKTVLNDSNEVQAVEIVCKEQTNIMAIADGIVYEVKKGDEEFTVTIKHKDDYFSTVSCKGKLKVKEGKKVREGSVIAVSDKFEKTTLTLSLNKGQTVLNPILYF